MTSSRDGETRTIRLLRLGADQVVEIPEDMELAASEVYVWQDGDRLVISPLPPEGPLPADTGGTEPR